MATGNSNLIRVLDDRVRQLYNEGKVDDAIRVARTAVETARRSNDNSDEARQSYVSALEVLGTLLRFHGDFQESETLLIEALHSTDRSTSMEQIGRLMGTLAVLYDFNDHYDQAVPLYRDAIEILGNVDPCPEEDLANLCNNFGLICKSQEQFEDAEKYYLQALEIFERLYGREDEDVASVYNNLGGLYQAAGHIDEALEMHLSALEIRQKIHESQIDSHPDIGQSYCNLAAVYQELEQYEDAQRNYLYAIDIFERNLDSDGENYSIASSNYADLLRSTGHERKANSLEKKAQKRLKKVAEKRYAMAS